MGPVNYQIHHPEIQTDRPCEPPEREEPPSFGNLSGLPHIANLQDDGGYGTE